MKFFSGRKCSRFQKIAWGEVLYISTISVLFTECLHWTQPVLVMEGDICAPESPTPCPVSILWGRQTCSRQEQPREGRATVGRGLWEARGSPEEVFEPVREVPEASCRAVELCCEGPEKLTRWKVEQLVLRRDSWVRKAQKGQ